VQKIIYIISNRIYLDCITLQTKQSVPQWTTARCWIPNNNAIRPTSRASFHKIDITRLGSSWRTVIVVIIIIIIISGVRLSPLGTAVTVWPTVPAPDDDECRAAGGMRIDRENRSTWREPTPVPFCPPQIPHDLTWARTRRLTAWATARPSPVLSLYKLMKYNQLQL
jgi:hypothetical protein